MFQVYSLGEGQEKVTESQKCLITVSNWSFLNPKEEMILRADPSSTYRVAQTSQRSLMFYYILETFFFFFIEEDLGD